MITAKIGNRIRELRTQTGLSQEKFAQKIGMDRTYFASVELGKRNISIVNIEKIANGLEISLSELFKDIESESGLPDGMFCIVKLEWLSEELQWVYLKRHIKPHWLIIDVT